MPNFEPKVSPHRNRANAGLKIMGFQINPQSTN